VLWLAAQRLIRMILCCCALILLTVKSEDDGEIMRCGKKSGTWV
jgi:hypothetical protein